MLVRVSWGALGSFWLRFFQRAMARTPSTKSVFLQTSLLRAGRFLLEKAFLFLRRFKPVRERVTVGEFNDHVEQEHLARYRFAQGLCRGKRVADIACGTGYGSEILAETALSVDRFDKELLCGNRAIDLEKEAWDDRYDVIVSFETIEHLANPEFFFENARRTTDLLIVSTPIGEFKGYNPFHKQVWTLAEFKAVVEKYFHCEYFYQDGVEIHAQRGQRVRFIIVVGTPKRQMPS